MLTSDSLEAARCGRFPRARAFALRFGATRFLSAGGPDGPQRVVAVMWYGFAADVVVLLHLGFIAFVVAGGALVLRWRAIVFVHGPAAFWGAYVELANRVCPLTPLENWLRLRAGQEGYAGGFIERYVIPILYPDGLDRDVQVVLGVLVVVVNIVVYVLVAYGRRRQGQSASNP